MAFRQVRLIAVNIDGVLLNDTFSPVIHRFVVRRGGVYTAELERAVLSQTQLRAAAAMGVPGTPEEVVSAYFVERDEYLREHPVRVLDGARALLERLRATGASLVCYGGLARPHFDRYLAPLAAYFDGPGYVCTDSFRPGVREIAEDVFSLRCDQTLFIDDVARVGEAAQDLGAAFIGHPTSYEHSFQRQWMGRAGVRHIVGSLDEIDERLLGVVDAEAAAGRCPATAAHAGERVHATT
ncbi:haloacid dehalogenase-like hydrolase [Streptomyces yokosukanensis]|uniref:Haloacid dehalogenase-like hydrolase n=1 Tax=Streptomyces yokosukanensis TaxID=67386 RepID=A0A117PZT1_9ACTN|nr:haloacid dehalogenase-like hydrolase [Streptomyces yokosukanensis]KUN00476.1 haloacid dehalogenase-like hydrolase [Streptomyces yokosukanensis]